MYNYTANWSFLKVKLISNQWRLRTITEKTFNTLTDKRTDVQTEGKHYYIRSLVCLQEKITVDNNCLDKRNDKSSNSLCTSFFKRWWGMIILSCNCPFQTSNIGHNDIVIGLWKVIKHRMLKINICLIFPKVYLDNTE